MRGSVNLNKRDHRQLSGGPIRRPQDRYAIEDNQRQEYGSRQLQVTQRLVNEQPIALSRSACAFWRQAEPGAKEREFAAQLRSDLSKA